MRWPYCNGRLSSKLRRSWPFPQLIRNESLYSMLVARHVVLEKSFSVRDTKIGQSNENVMAMPS